MNHLEKIEEIKNHPDVNVFDIYNGKDKDWEHYFAIKGYYKRNYFCVYFTKSKRNKPNIDISELTDEKEQFIKDFGLCH